MERHDVLAMMTALKCGATIKMRLRIASSKMLL